MELAGTMNKNSLVILVIGVLIGAAMYLSLIGSLSFLLSNTNPLFAVYMLAAGYSVFILVIRFLIPTKMKFALFNTLIAIIFIGLLAALLLPVWSDSVRAIAWYGISVFGVAYFKWALFRITVLHLNPAKAQAQFFYNHRAYEIGTLIVVVLLITLFATLPPRYIIDASILILTVMALLQVIFLCPKKNVEINIDKKQPREDLRDVPAFQNMASVFIFVALFLGAMETFASYAVNVFLHLHLISYEELIHTVTLIFLLSSMGLIVISSLVGKITIKFRFSPTHMLHIHAFIIAAIAIYCFFEPSLIAFIALMVVTLTSQGIFHYPAAQMITASFPAEERSWLSTMNVQYAMAVPSVLASLLLSFSLYVQYDPVLDIVLFLVILSAAIAIGLIIYFRTALIRAFYYNIRLEHKGAAVLAAQALSYLNPKDYNAKMLEILQTNPKKLLRKMIIVGLGYKGDTDIIHHLRKEFESDKEEVQLSVLDALSHCKDFANIEFVIEVLLGKHLTRSMNVRISAAKILAGLYGKRAIPILLYGLRDQDKRIQANALEVLSMFKDKSLLKEIRPFADSPVPRTKANALLALSRFHPYREIYRKGITEMLTSNDENLMSSALYVVGKNRDIYFLSNIMLLLKLGYQDRPMMKRILAHTLTCLHNEKGYQLFEELFNTPYRPGTQEDFVHLFAQLDYELRFDVLEYLMRKHPKDEAFRHNIYQHLKNASFDFHEEVDFLFA